MISSPPIWTRSHLRRMAGTHHEHDLVLEGAFGMAASLEVAPVDPGSVRFSVDLPPGWADRYTVEFVDDEGDSDFRMGAANHLWDCRVLNRCAAEIIGDAFLETAGGATGAQTQ